MADKRSSLSKLKDVARLAGVGNATVSRALNGGQNVSTAAMERISAAIQELDYRPNRAARSLKGASSGIIGMVVPSLSDLFFSQCAESVEAVVRERGGVLVVAASHDDDAIAVDSVRQLLLHNIDGLVIAYAKVPPRALVDLLRSAHLPIVGIDGPLIGVGCPSVLCENYEGACMGTEHLLWHGYRKIVSVQVKPDLYTMRERLRGYRSAIAEGGVRAIEETITDRASASDVLKRHVQRGGPPTAFFAGNNLSARYLCEAIHELGLAVPRQVAILSFDDFDLADMLTPPMSVVQQPLEQIGRSAADLLFQERPEPLPGPKAVAGHALMLKPRLLIRQSCGCPPSSMPGSN